MEPETGDQHTVFVDELQTNPGGGSDMSPAAGGVRGRTPPVPGQPNAGPQGRRRLLVDP